MSVSLAFRSTKLAGLKRAAAALSLLSLATAFGAVLVLLTQSLLARQLGPSDYGLFASSLATVSMIAPWQGSASRSFACASTARKGGARIDGSGLRYD